MTLYALALLLSGSLAACKTRPPAASAERKPVAPEPSAPAQPPSDALEPDEFALPDDLPADPVEVLNALRHNCCDEMLAREVEAHVAEAAKRTEPPTSQTTGVRP